MDELDEYKSKLLLLAECNKTDHWKDEVVEDVEKLEVEIRNKINRKD